MKVKEIDRDCDNDVSVVGTFSLTCTYVREIVQTWEMGRMHG